VDRQSLSEDNSSFTYKGKAVDIKQLGRELGVRYFLEGTLQALKTHRREVVAQADVQPCSHHDP
jgi:TolB-like protein